MLWGCIVVLQGFGALSVPQAAQNVAGKPSKDKRFMEYKVHRAKHTRIGQICGSYPLIHQTLKPNQLIPKENQAVLASSQGMSDHAASEAEALEIS